VVDYVKGLLNVGEGHELIKQNTRFKQFKGTQGSQFDIQTTVHRDTFLQQNQRDTLISQFYFRNRNLHVSDSSSAHHQLSGTVHTAVVYVTQVMLTAR
jgi:hypothetical protein